MCVAVFKAEEFHTYKDINTEVLHIQTCVLHYVFIKFYTLPDYHQLE